MKPQYYLLLAGIISFFVILGVYSIGDICMIPMFICIILLLALLKRNEIIWNILLLVFTYALSLIIDNLTTLIWNCFGWNMQNQWWLYVLVNFPVYVMLSRFVSKQVVKIKEKISVMFPLRIMTILVGNVTVCMVIFVMQVLFERRVGGTPMVLWGNIILYIAYFILTFSLIYVFMKEYRKNVEIMLKQQSYENLRMYMTQIEELYQQLRGFKHDYANIMASMASYIEYEDLEGLKEYYHREILPISAKINKSNDAVTKLHNLDIVELKSLMSLKLNYALERNIEISLEVAEKIHRVEMKTLDLVRVVGILLYNAIEACQECEKACMQIAIVRMEKNVTFIISNTYVKHDIDYLKLGTEGISSKGKQRGIGLYNIKNILNEYDNVFLDTEFGEKNFTQTLQICATDKDGKESVV
jgi:two-component system sensor histidine kinase AgrC